MKNPTGNQPPPRRTLWRGLFWVHSILLSIGLLWPQLQVPAVVPRPDLIAHCLAFGPFSLLLCLWNPFRLQRAAAVAGVAGAIGTAYGGLTEFLQAIPILHRSAGLDDWLADVLGVVCGLAAFACVKMRGPTGWPRDGRSADT